MDNKLSELSKPVAYTEQCEISNMQATGLYLRGFPDNSQGRNIPPYTAPPAPANAQPVAWEMRYWSDGYNIWGDWESITEDLHTRLSAEHAADSDYEFRVLYDAPPAPAVPPEATPENIENLLADITLFFTAGSLSHGGAVMFSEVWNACRAAMLAQPVSGGYKLSPHVYRELVNSLRDTAVKYQGTQQLREQLSRTLTDKGLSAAAPEGGNDHDTRR